MKYTEVTLPDNVTSIGERAFASSTVEHVTIPATVRSIGLEAFLYSLLLASPLLTTRPTQLTKIADRAFANTSLSPLSLPVVTIAEVLNTTRRHHDWVPTLAPTSVASGYKTTSR